MIHSYSITGACPPSNLRNIMALAAANNSAPSGHSSGTGGVVVSSGTALQVGSGWVVCKCVYWAARVPGLVQLSAIWVGAA